MKASFEQKAKEIMCKVVGHDFVIVYHEDVKAIRCKRCGYVILVVPFEKNKKPCRFGEGFE